MAMRVCLVSFTDGSGVSHSVEVSAASVFEAAASAFDAFRQHEWSASAITPVMVLQIEVRAPAVVHRVPLSALEAWRRSPPTSPRESLAKRR